MERFFEGGGVRLLFPLEALLDVDRPLGRLGLDWDFFLFLLLFEDEEEDEEGFFFLDSDRPRLARSEELEALFFSSSP
jgi:hypothetical protein